ncbi:hypothetical protein ACHAWU_001738 [Discostella pseudostelligera]|uniref:Uncharacterized protein n=1 Tax=Discostella pseudostelligera TaxID=259834 RepID=A0ABD3M8Z1_9STRA
MASFLQHNNPWIESTILYAASFDPAICQDETDANGDDDDDINEEEVEEPQTENTIPSGLLPSPKHGSSKNGQSLRNATPPSRKGKIVQVIQRGGDYDWNNNKNWQGRRPRGNGNDTYCLPYLVIHDGQYAAIAFLSPETLQELSSSPTIISNRSLVSITHYTVSTILQCCQKNQTQQQQQKKKQQSKKKMTKTTSFDFDTHSGILNHLYFTATNNINNTNNHHHHPHEPNGYTLIPPTIQTQLPHQIPNNELYLCLYIQGTITMIGAENQGLIGFPKDVHCSIPLRRVLREHEEMYESFWNEDGNGTLSHFMLIDKLKAVHGYYRMLDQKKYGSSEEAVIVDDIDDDDEEVEDDDNDEEEEEEEGEQQHDPPRGVVGGRTKKQYGQRGRKKRDKDIDRHHRTATSASQTKRTTTTTTTASKSLMTNVIPGWPWESRLVEGHPSRIAPTARAATVHAPGASAAAASNNDTDREIASAMLMMRNSPRGQDDSGDIIADGGEGRVSAAAASAQGGGNPNTEAAVTPTTVSTPHPPLGNVQELLELGLDIELFLGVESQSESYDNAVQAEAATPSAASAVGDGTIDDRNLNTEEREVEADGTEMDTEEPNEQQQSSRAFGTQEETSHQASFVGINDMLVDEDDNADEDNGDDEQNDGNSVEVAFENGGGNYDDYLDGTDRLLQTQPESTAYYHGSHSPNRARETGEERDSQTPQSIRNAGNQPLRPTDEYSRSLQRIEEAEEIAAKASSRRKQSRRNKSKRRSEEEDDEDEYPIPMSQRKVPPETLEGYAVLESQIPVPSPRGTSTEPVARANDEEDDEAKDEEDYDQLVGGQSQIPTSTKSRRVVEHNKKAGRPTTRFKRRIEEDEEEEDDYPIPVSQRKAPPETLEGYAVLESQIPLPPPRGASREPVTREEAEEQEEEEEKEEQEEEDDKDDDDDEDYYPPGRQSQIPINTKLKRVEKQTKKADNSTAKNSMQSKSPRMEIHISDDDSSDEWMRVRKHKKQDVSESESEDSSDDWMKVHKITNRAKRHRAVNDDIPDNDVVDDDAKDVDDDASDESSYEPTFEAQMAGEGSEEAVPPSSPGKTSGKRAARQQRKPSKEAKANYDVAAFSSKASIVLGFSSSKVSVQKKVGKKKPRGEQFDVASFVDKAQRLCGL